MVVLVNLLFLNKKPIIKEKIMERLSIGKAILVEFALIIGIGLLMGLYYLLHLSEMWVGFLFILWWSTAMKLDISELLNTGIGGVIGIGLAYLITNPPLTQGYGMAIAGALVILSVFFMIRGQLGSFINGSTMLFLTVSTIPNLLQSAAQIQYLHYIEVLVLTTVLFWVVFKLAGKAGGKATAS